MDDPAHAWIKYRSEKPRRLDNTIFRRMYANAQSVLTVAQTIGSRSELTMTMHGCAYQAARLFT